MEKSFFFLHLRLCLTHAYFMPFPHNFSYAYACHVLISQVETRLKAHKAV